MRPAASRERRRLKYVATMNDEALPETTAPDFELEYIDIGNVDSLGAVHEVTSYRFETAPSRARRVVRHGDVIISTVRTYLQAIATISYPPENLVVSTGFAVVRPRDGVLDPGFCKFALREPRFLWEVESRSVGVSYPAINSSDLGDIRVELPPIAEQRHIADYLDAETAQIDALVAEKERMLALLQEKRAVLISGLVTRGPDPCAPLKPSGIEWLGEIPAHWKVRRGKYLFRQSELAFAEEDQIVTCFRNGEVTLRKNRREEGFTNAEKESSFQGIRAGQLVLHSMDAFAGAIGVSDSNGKCSLEYVICDPVHSSTSSRYYGYLLRVMALRGFILAACPAVRQRAPRIRFSDITEMFLPVPSLQEQESVVRAIRSQEEEAVQVEAMLRRSITLLKERRGALITAAVTGQLSTLGTP